MKYVRIDVGLGRGKSKIARGLVVAFPNDLVHSIVAEALTAACREQWPGATVKVKSAGDLSVYAEGAHGHSESLKLKSIKIDAHLFNSADYSGHIL